MGPVIRNTLLGTVFLLVAGVSMSPVILPQKFEREHRLTVLKGWVEGFRNAK